MNNKIFCLLAIASCATMLTACNDEQKQPRAEMVMTHHAMVNGTSDKSDAHKAVVGLYMKNPSSTCGSEGIFCTGTLIHPQWILTAAHCITDMNEYTGKVSASSCNKYVKIGFGNDETTVAKNLYDTAGTSYFYYHNNYGDRQLSTSQWSEDYYYSTIDSDIALIKLKAPVPSTVATPILPHPDWLKINTKSLATNMVFSGFGFNEKGDMGTKLQFTGSVTKYCGPANADDSEKGCKEGSVTYSGCHPSPDYCSYYGYYRNETEYILMPYGSIYYDQLKGGPCQGDSGGPAFYTQGGVEYVSGITSYGDGICAAYGISTAVQDYYDWIISKAPEVADQYAEICDNKVDDDGDGKVDANDPDCKTTKPYCGDGIVNNDEQCDGTAFLNNIKKCAQLDSKYDSGNVYCSSDCKYNFSACSLATVAEICDDGIDNDKDGAVDCNDYDCMFDAACLPKPEICDDGIDNDKDGAVDCNDSDCKNDPACTIPAEICDDGIDNDKDGAVDCNDYDCMFDAACLPKPEICDDGIDNDKDGATDCNDYDCRNDPACSLPAPDTQPEICYDGIDNDKDGATDCDDYDCINDSACASAPDSQPEICDDGIDNDRDGLTDCFDYDCMYDAVCLPASAEICDDGIDNDRDGLSDCQDDDCATFCASNLCGNGVIDGNEKCDGNAFLLGENTCHGWVLAYASGLVTCNPNCTINYSQCVAADGLNSSAEICDNGIDDNRNGLPDCADPACFTAPNCQQGIASEICGDGIDNDNDGAIDCADSDCKYSPLCPSSSTEICDNHIDDDNNGLIDCNDPACFASAACSKTEICGNNIDDDGNGKADCEDPACASHSTCATNAPTENCTNGIDDDGDGAVDCNDIDCKNNQQCLNSGKSVCANADGSINCQNPVCNDLLECQHHKVNADPNCQASPSTPATGSMTAFLLGLLGLGALIRRRREN